VEEMRNHGTDPETRFRRMRESVEAMKAIWAEDEAEYHGRIVDFDPIWCWPKPVQTPHPPILVGGRGERVLDRVVAYGDGWIPNRVASPESLGELIAELQERAEAAGRGRIPVTVFGAKPEPRLLDRLRAAGVTRSLLYLPAAPPDEVEHGLDQLAKVAVEWAG
jgi:alkanesulfonate monooxygenase SsuD/methylene tetrahydromethanopterin reductase-like flavin-dependent oxidoreductase (luciferase family)